MLRDRSRGTKVHARWRRKLWVSVVVVTGLYVAGYFGVVLLMGVGSPTAFQAANHLEMLYQPFEKFLPEGSVIRTARFRVAQWVCGNDDAFCARNSHTAR